ncbi:hypothetical protein NRIC_17950 [Enterococcus florum]|uniref:Gram-positive cocci surface proteins LPxTG domain-containing protein n=1 Tax=Enterococcus florum TaxID=2480627 RepID=A0A4P5PBQ5_9ENTE|nr:immunoglobulin-like domain-containing protein [Enterococcus florum]GCF93904.1 hypothetical protein NRIC_17950 [Enterococcus florum]
MKRKQLSWLAITSLLVPAMISTTAVAAEQQTAETTVAETKTQPEAVQPEGPAEQQAEENAPNDPPAVAPAAADPATQTAPAAENNVVVSEKAEVAPLDVKPFPPNVPTETHPVINVIPVLTIRKGEAFDPMKGVSASDKTDGDLTGSVTHTGTVDVNTPGEYLITYKVVNSQGNEATQSVIVKVVEDDIGMYTIELDDFKLPKNADYIQAIKQRITIKKEGGTEIPTAEANIMVSSHHSTAEAGTIAVEVAVLSEYNTVTKKIVTITILDDAASVRIAITGTEPIKVEVGESFDPYVYAKAYALNTTGEAEEELAKASGDGAVGLWAASTVDTATPGEYEVVYKATTALGATVSKTMKVKVFKGEETEKEKRKPVILVEDKVMYVGDKLTKEMVLAWAKTENPEDTITGFKVLEGKEIKVRIANDTLAETGTYQIEFYASTPEGEEISKIITLTVKQRSGEGSGISGNTGGTTNMNHTYNNTNQTQKKTVPQTGKQLPRTGAEVNGFAPIFGGLILGLAALIQRKRHNV